MKIYHNPRCSKSRSTLELIRAQGINPEVIEYLKNPLTEKEIKDLLKKLGMKASELLRKSELLYRVKYESLNLTDKELITLMAEFPTLIERPIVVLGEKAVIGRPPENILLLL